MHNSYFSIAEYIIPKLTDLPIIRACSLNSFTCLIFWLSTQQLHNINFIYLLGVNDTFSFIVEVGC